MRMFPAGDGRIHALAYSPDSRSLLVDVRGAPAHHPWMVFSYHPAQELVWWDWPAGTARRRFRLRDSLYGPGGALTAEDDRGDWDPQAAALDVSFCATPFRVAIAWEFTNKEDGVCVYDPDTQATVALRVPYKTHLLRLALSPDGGRLAAAMLNGMDGPPFFEVWDLAAEPEGAPDPGPGQGTPRPGRPAGRGRLREEQEACPSPFDLLAALAFDGKWLAAAGAGVTRALVWDSSTPPPPGARADSDDEPDPGAPVDPASLPGAEIGFIPRCLAFAPAGPLLAVGGKGLVTHDPASGQPTPFTRSGPVVRAVAFTADGRVLLAGTDAGAVEVWDVAGRRLRKALDWGEGPVTALALAPDGNTAAAGTDTGRVIVWDLDG